MLGTEPVRKLLISMAIPSIVAMLMQALYNTVDSMYVAKISDQSFAAVTLAYPVQMIIGALSTGIGVGINSSISRHLGAGEPERASKAASNGIVLGFGTLINAGVVVSHDGKIGQCVNLSPGALLAGAVTVEDFAQIGMGATINLGITIGSRARIGNSAVVKADVPADGRVYAGSIWPAHTVKPPLPHDFSFRKIA